MTMTFRLMAATFVVFVGSALLVPSAAAVSGTIVAGQPTANGTVTITITDVNSGLKADVTVTGILATDTPAQKATKINNAINAQLTADGPPISDLFESTVTGNRATVTKTGGGRMRITINTDTTSEGTGLRVVASAAGTPNPMWDWSRTVVAANNSVVLPGGATYTLNTTNGVSASVTSDGVQTVGQLQDDLTTELEAEGVDFTEMTDPITGDEILTSQFFAISPADLTTGFGIDTSPGFIGDLGGVGVAITSTPEPESLALLATGLMGGLLTLRRRM